MKSKQRYKSARPSRKRFLNCGGPSIAFILAFPSLFNNAFAGQVNIDTAVTVPGTYMSPWAVGDDLSVGNTATGSLTVTNGSQVTDLNAYVGNNTGAQGAVTLSGAGTEWRSNEITVGHSGSGIVTVQSGASINSGPIVIGRNATGDGQLILTGVGTNLGDTSTLKVGSAGNGSFSITGGAIATLSSSTSVGDEVTGVGLLSISGTGSKFAGQQLMIGYAGQGQINVTDGATLFSGGTTFGAQSTARGIGNFSGANTQWSPSSSIAVGDHGYGELNISQGATLNSTTSLEFAVSDGSIGIGTLNAATVNSNNLTVAGHGIGTFTASNGSTINAGGVHIAEDSGSVGLMTVTGTGTHLNGSDYLQIGQNGTGTLSLSDGATATINGSTSMGDDVTGVGLLTVSGADSTFTGQTLTVGYAGQGQIDVTDGASLTTQGATFGSQITGRGVGNLSGANTQWSTGGEIMVGADGYGELNLSEGAALNSTAALWLATNAGSVGIGTLNAATVNLNNLIIAGHGVGTFTASSGSTINSGGVHVAQDSGSVGLMTVTGTGTLLNDSGYLQIGQNGTGTLNLNDGATAASGFVSLGTSANGTLNITGGSTLTGRADVAIGDLAGGIGTATVSGNGSSWSSESEFDIGRAGEGTLTLSDGGSVSTAQNIVIAKESTATGTLNIGAALGSVASAAGSVTTTNGISFGAGAGVVNFNHIGTNYVFGNILSGIGTVNALAGTTIFDKDQSYTGSTHIASGATLQIGTGNAGGSIVSDVVNNGTLVFNRSDSSTYAGSTSGAGNLEQNGAGTLTLTGASTYTGITVVNNGVLKAGGSGALSSASSYVVNNGTLDLNNFDLATNGMAGIGGFVSLGNATLTLNQQNDSTFASVISGTGALIKNGNGILTLSGANPFSGGVALLEGGLGITNDSALGTGTLDMRQGTYLNFSRVGTTTLANRIILTGDPTFNIDTGSTAVMSGDIVDGSIAGDLVKTGNGALILTGSDSFTSGTTVSAGSLTVGGQLVSHVDVLSDASLSGTGQVGAVNVASGGLLDGGATGSGLTVNGDLNLASGATYSVQLGAAGTSGLTTVNGNMQFASGALLKLIGAPDTSNPLGTRYTIFRYSGSQTGTFGLDSSYIYVAPNVLYNNNEVTLNFVPSAQLQQNGFSLSGSTSNEIAVANALTTIYHNGGTPLTDTLLLTSEAQARAGLSSMANSAALDSLQMAVRRTEQAEAGIATHLASTAQDGVWLQNTRQDGHFQGNSYSGANAYNDSENILTLGVDGHVVPAWRLGVAISATDGHASYAAGRGKNSSNGTLMSLYSGYQPETSALYVNGIASFGAWHNSVSRNVDLAVLYSDPHGAMRTLAANFYAETGMKLEMGEHVLNPYAALDVGHYRQAAFKEKSRNSTNDFDLRYDRTTKIATSGTLGLRTEHKAQLAGYPLTFQADVAWRHRFGNDTDTFSAAFETAPDTDFKLTGARIDRDELRTRVGTKWALPGDFSLNLNVGSDLSRTRNYQTEVGITWHW